jgi:hypothetical protein
MPLWGLLHVKERSWFAIESRAGKRHGHAFWLELDVLGTARHHVKHTRCRAPATPGAMHGAALQELSD